MKKERLKKAGFALWVFIHVFLLMLGFLYRDGKGFHYAIGEFYPWGDYHPIRTMGSIPMPIEFRIENYDILEFIIYVITPIFLYYLYRYIKGEKIPFIK